MPVIALTQEMGSLAKEIAMDLATSMNLSLMRHEVVEHVAEKMHIPQNLITRLREGKAGFIDRMTTDQDRLALYAAEEVFDLANEGNVVLRGWGSTCLLRPVTHVVCVRITRSFSKRVDWLMDFMETDDREFAEMEIRRSDNAHASRMREQFGAIWDKQHGVTNWGDPILYDLALNTDRMSISTCVDLIRSTCARPEFQETAQSRQLLDNLTLSARVRAALKDHEPTEDVNITIDVDKGRVTLTGIVLNQQQKDETEKVAAGVSGVNDIDNKLRVMASRSRFSSARLTGSQR